MPSLQTLKSTLDDLQAEYRVTSKNLQEYTAQYEALGVEITKLDDMQEMFQIASKLMYDNLSIKLGNIITEGLSIVFPEEELTFTIEFVERRNTIEADLYLLDKSNNKYHPLDAVGGGVADFISILLRCTYVILSTYDNTLVCDEPLKFLDRERISLGAEFINKLCMDFDLQILMVSHIPEIIELAEKVYHIEKKKTKSVCTSIRT